MNGKKSGWCSEKRMYNSWQVPIIHIQYAQNNKKNLQQQLDSWHSTDEIDK